MIGNWLNDVIKENEIIINNDKNYHNNMISISNMSQLLLLVKSNNNVHIRMMNIKSYKKDTKVKYKTIICNPPLHNDSYALYTNKNGEYVCILSPKGIQIVSLPKHGLEATLAVRYENIKCPSFYLGEYDIRASSNITITKILWHPYSRDGTHIVVLVTNKYSNNVYGQSLYFYDILTPERAQWSKILIKPPAKYNELFQSMTFGVSEKSWNMFTLYFCKRNNGDVYALCPIVPKGCKLNEKKLHELESLMIESYENEASSKFQIYLCTQWMNQTWLQIPIENDYIAYPPKTGEIVLQGPINIIPPLNDTNVEIDDLICLHTEKLDKHIKSKLDNNNNGIILSVLARLYSNNTLDILVQLTSIVPCLESTNRNIESYVPKWPMLSFDRVQLESVDNNNNNNNNEINNRWQLITDRYEPELIIAYNNNNLFVITLPWLMELWSLSATSPSAVHDIVNKINSSSSCLNRVQNKDETLNQLCGILVFCDPMIGRFCISLNDQGVDSFDLLPFAHRSMLASILESDHNVMKQRDHLSNFPQSQFKDKVNNLLDKYEKTTVLNKSKLSHLTLNNSAHLKEFHESVRDPLIAVIKDLRLLQLATNNRMRILEKARSAQNNQIKKLEEALFEIKKTNEGIVRQLIGQNKVQHLLVERAKQLEEKQAEILNNRPSKSELEFHQSLLKSRNTLKIYKHDITDIKNKTNKLQAILQNNKTNLKHVAIPSQIKNRLQNELNIQEQAIQKFKQICKTLNS